MTRSECARFALEALGSVISRPETELKYNSEYELIVAVILSAQCTDARVNMVTPAVFAEWPTFEAMEAAAPADVARVIASISYPNNKSRHLVRMAGRVVADHAGQLPRSVDGLMQLPGVGRKTAQVVASVAFGDESALPVDTHVFRVANRIGLVERADTPLKVERGLKAVVPRGSWAKAHHLLILHGRYTCTARKPACHKCTVTTVCRFFAARGRLPDPLRGLDATKGIYYCKTRAHYFDEAAYRTDRSGLRQVACPKCGSMNVFAAKTGETTKRVRDYRVGMRQRR
ncbi:MAG: endonuclease III [Bacteroidota bacterium]|nr:endonuclease III [Bacteroidota bacterium]MDE2833191.1 endonuclease III [Bacteroidota bacterium]